MAASMLERIAKTTEFSKSITFYLLYPNQDNLAHFTRSSPL
jgi:hypothetical protein